MKYFVLAYYHFTPIEFPKQLIKHHKKFFEGRDATARIYISEEGINGQMSASQPDAEAYMEWLHADPRFKDVEFKIHQYHENCFPRLTVKYRKQICAMDVPANVRDGGEHISPAKWREMLENRDEDTVLIDVRNDYESAIGHFEGAECPDLKTFREFPAYAEALSKQKDPEKTKIMMYCTGGIRCELYSVLFKKHGFKNVFQLQGGVIKYGQKEGEDHWKGKLFVFDDRLAVPITQNGQPETLTTCHFCQTKSDTYFNCANMDCNELFTCCPACAAEHQGCCCHECTTAPRCRSYEPSETPKPFRKRQLI